MGIPKETQNALHVRKSYRTNSNGLVASFQHLIKGTTCSCTSPCTRPRVFLLAFLETNPCPTLYSTETINGSRYCMFPGHSQILAHSCGEISPQNKAFHSGFCLNFYPKLQNKIQNWKALVQGQMEYGNKA